MSGRGSTTTQRGLGWSHQQRKAKLIRGHKDGAPCPCLDLDDCGPACPCRQAGHGLPMHKDPALNVDGRPLEADHTRARSQGGGLADRLLLAVCNRSRGDGTRTTEQPTRPDWWTRTWYDAPEPVT
jgi:hypothetical protein